jgi:hypothetical protein
MARLRPVFCRTLLPGCSTVPVARLVMFFTRRSSIPTQPWRLARSVVSLWVKSSRLRVCRAPSAAVAGVPLGPAELAGLAALQAEQAPLLSLGERRRHQPRLRLVGDERGAGHPEVHPAARQAVRRGRLGAGRRAERDVPAESVAADGGVAHLTTERPGKAEPQRAHLRQAHLGPAAAERADLHGLAGERHRQAGTALAEGGCLGWVAGVPPVVVGAVELPEDLLGGLRRQLCQPRQLSARLGEIAALPDGADGDATLPPGELALFQRQVPHRAAAVPPLGQALSLLGGWVGTVATAGVGSHAHRILGLWDRRRMFALEDTAFSRCMPTWFS